MCYLSVVTSYLEGRNWTEDIRRVCILSGHVNCHGSSSWENQPYIGLSSKGNWVATGHVRITRSNGKQLKVQICLVKVSKVSSKTCHALVQVMTRLVCSVRTINTASKRKALRMVKPQLWNNEYISEEPEVNPSIKVKCWFLRIFLVLFSLKTVVLVTRSAEHGQELWAVESSPFIGVIVMIVITTHLRAPVGSTPLLSHWILNRWLETLRQAWPRPLPPSITA